MNRVKIIINNQTAIYPTEKQIKLKGSVEDYKNWWVEQQLKFASRW